MANRSTPPRGAWWRVSSFTLLGVLMQLQLAAYTARPVCIAHPQHFMSSPVPTNGKLQSCGKQLLQVCGIAAGQSRSMLDSVIVLRDASVLGHQN
eukprot:292791-Chlamydomonas_euryale.AAC.9